MLYDTLNLNILTTLSMYVHTQMNLKPYTYQCLTSPNTTFPAPITSTLHTHNLIMKELAVNVVVNVENGDLKWRWWTYVVWVNLQHNNNNNTITINTQQQTWLTLDDL